ncbi:hypothetical protein BDZ85DRAFT_86793 [Elsinoe ampelina]|uniref:Uncharacterized protein n=1 Tax=Elsinoe ampelina TaxID=302913 RepID=A0A6A6GGY3_9PEZI|nr:hypothetical protein BDZ85DRAFT_86793 [Elsinoe ampelina]
MLFANTLSTITPAVARVTGDLTTGGPVKSNEQFKINAMASRPILAQTLAVLETGDADKIEKFVNGGSGYQIDLAANSKEIGENSKNKTAMFDVSLFAGLYKSNGPAELKGTESTIDPTTGNSTWDPMTLEVTPPIPAQLLLPMTSMIMNSISQHQSLKMVLSSHTHSPGHKLLLDQTRSSRWIALGVASRLMIIGPSPCHRLRLRPLRHL